MLQNNEPRRKKSSGFQKGHTPWNKGLKGVQVHSLKTRDKMSKSKMGHEVSEETRAKISDKISKYWEDPLYASKILHRRSPSYPEKVFIDLCYQYQLPLRYVGNGALIIGNKNPDFVCITNDHKLIEIWGDHWHKGQNPQDRIDFFKIRGYQCLVILVSEFKCVDNVISKVRDFCETTGSPI